MRLTDVPRTASLWALLLMALSASAFVLFEVGKMIWVSWSVRRFWLVTDDDQNYPEQLQQLQKIDQRNTRVFGKAWFFALFLTIPTGVGALGVLAYNVLLVLLAKL